MSDLDGLPPREVDKLFCLQAGRALASLAVVLHHASLAAVAFGGPFVGAMLLEAGYLGVDFFFVLSGFIIHHSTVDRGKGPADYAAARILRVYPPYLPIGIGIALLYVLFPGVSAGDREWSWLATLTLLPISPETALSVAWTLKHEMLFYFLFGILYFSGRLYLGLALWGGAIIIATLAGVTGVLPLSTLNLEFLMGVAAAYLARRGFGPAWLYAAALVALLWWLGLGAMRAHSPLVGLAFALLILPVVQRERAGRLAVPKGLVFLGAASYSTYLVHSVVISLAARAVAGQAPWLVLVTCILAGVIGGIIYYWLIERPTLRWRPSWTRQRLQGSG